MILLRSSRSQPSDATPASELHFSRCHCANSGACTNPDTRASSFKLHYSHIYECSDNTCVSRQMNSLEFSPVGSKVLTRPRCADHHHPSVNLVAKNSIGAVVPRSQHVAQLPIVIIHFIMQWLALNVELASVHCKHKSREYD